MTAANDTHDAVRLDVIVNCPAGKKVLSGGFQTVGNNQYATIMTNGPLSESSWAVSAFQSDLTGGRSWTLQAFAICANVAP